MTYVVIARLEINKSYLSGNRFTDFYTLWDQRTVASKLKIILVTVIKLIKHLSKR